jgi:hypothetical protein
MLHVGMSAYVQVDVRSFLRQGEAEQAISLNRRYSVLFVVTISICSGIMYCNFCLRLVGQKIALLPDQLRYVGIIGQRIVGDYG